MKSQNISGGEGHNDTAIVRVLPDVAPSAFNQLSKTAGIRHQAEYVVSMRCKFSTHVN
jgi:hypothetical protein